jgi:long-subunit fatty acid transport protein
MKSKISVLTIFFLLFVSVYAWGEQKFDGVETDTVLYPTIQNFFLSPFQLTDYNFLGGGARARGMGGAFLSISDDPSAASWNPAGLTQMDKPQMVLNFSSYMHRLDYTTSGININYENSSKLKHDNNSISFASVVIPFKIKEKGLVGSVLFQKLADIYQKNEYVFTLDHALTLNSSGSELDTLDNYVLDQLNDESVGSLNAVSVSLGGKIYNSLSLGLGINIYGGNFITDENLFYALGDNTALDYPYVDTTGLNGYIFRPHIKSNYSGANMTFGAMYKLNKFSLGAVVKTPFNLKEKNDLKVYTDILDEGVILESSYLISPFFETDRKWKMPLMIGFGGSYQMNALTLSADIEYRGYSKTEVTYRKNIANPTDVEVTTGGYITNKWWGKKDVTPPSVSSLNWRNITQFRIGGEYILNTKYGKFPLRAGFRNDPKPYTSQTTPEEIYMMMKMSIATNGKDTIYTPKFIQSDFGTKNGSWIDGKIISLGTGIAWTQIKLDITYEYATYPDVKDEITTARRRFNNGIEISQPLERHSYTRQETKNHYSRLMISFTGMF